MQRPVVVLPQPDSPTRPSVSPLRIVKLMPSTAFTWPTVARNQRALGHREVHFQVANREQDRRLGDAPFRMRASVRALCPAQRQARPPCRPAVVACLRQATAARS